MFGRGLALLIYIAVLTTTLQHWVGQSTLYSAENAAIRLKVHDLLVRRSAETPTTNLSTLESYGNERRVVIPWLAESITRIVGRRETTLPAVYYYLDYAFLYLSFLLFWFYLRRWFGGVDCLLGLSFLAVAMITTYHVHFFHPWDRATFLLWLILTMLVRDDRMAAYLPVLALALCTKFTAVLFPLFYLLLRLKDRSPLRDRRTWLMLGAQMVVIFLCNALLNYVSFVPASRLADSYLALTRNIMRMDAYFAVQLRFAHPAFLMFVCPAMLITWRWKHLNDFMRRSSLFGAFVLVVHFAFSYFVESRAQAVALIFLIPPALSSLKTVFTAEGRPPTERVA